MLSEIVMPRMGLTMESGTVVRWLRKEGENISAGEPLLEIETDKATVEIEALEGGTLQQIVAGIGQEVPVGGVIGYVLKPGESADAAIASMASGTGAVQAKPVVTTATLAPVIAQKVRASPAARRLAKNLDVPLAVVQGTGPHGRVVAWNVAEAASVVPLSKVETATRISPVARRVADDMGVDLAHVQGSGPGGTITRRDVELAAGMNRPSHAVEGGEGKTPLVMPFTRIQRVMADRMVQSFTTAPHFYLHTDVDARQLVTLREQVLQRLEESDGVRVTYTDLLVYFCARTLARHLNVLAQWTPNGLKQSQKTHIGIAIETENGLVVPVIHNAAQLGLVEIARRRDDLAARARNGKLLPEEFEEGMFTITNLGMYRVDAFDAILNPPQAAILAVGRIKERALAEKGQVIAAPMLTLSLSVDHRVLDGAQAAEFLGELAEMLEIPALSMK